MKPSALAFVEESVARVRAQGTPVAAAGFGVVDVYDNDQTMHWVRIATSPSICPLGAAAICTGPLASKDSTKVRSANKVEQAVAATLDVPVDYVFGFTQGYDGHEIWSGIAYGEDFLRGYNEGRGLRAGE